MSLKGRVYIFLATLIFAVILLLPTLFPAKFKGVNWISRPLSLGLDLKGGVYILYRVETDEAVKNRLQSILSSLRAEFRKKKIAATKLTALPGGKVELRFVGPSSASKAKEIIRELAPALQPLKEATSLSAKNSNTLFYVLPETAQNKIKREAVRDAVETLRRRVDQFGVAEPLIQPVGTDRILLQMPGVQDIEEVKKVIGSVAKLEFRLIPTPETPSYNQIELKTKSGSPIMVEDEVLMTGDAVEDARVSFTRTGEVEVSLTLTREGAEIFRNITSANVGRQLAIILDGIVYSHPVIREPIAGGRASITGGFTAAEAHALAVVLRAGALPAPLTALEERTVGPTLGKESIKRGALAITLSFALVMLFIAFYYKKAGLVTVGILITNLIFVLGLLSLFGATLTLPGLAGLALTIGMAVDANVIIYERIREELKSLSARDPAVKAGFEKALSSIIDANLTTLLAALILYYFGSGPVRGFAVTLSVGIITTIYCATFVSRLAFDCFSLTNKKGELSI